MGSADELDDVGGSGYVSRPIYRPVSAAAADPGNEFDDIMIWMGKSTLFQRMVAAGKLP